MSLQLASAASACYILILGTNSSFHDILVHIFQRSISLVSQGPYLQAVLLVLESSLEGSS